MMSWQQTAALTFTLAGFMAASCAVGTSEPQDSTGAGGASNSSTGSTSSEGSGGLDFASSSSSGGGDAECDNILPVTYRDFDETHPDMEMPFSGDVVRLQLVQPNLGSDLRPVFLSGIGCPQSPGDPTACDNWVPSQPVIQSADSFFQWYHSVDGVNMTFDKEIVLTETAPNSGVYVYDSDAFFPLSPSEGFGATPVSNNPQGLNYLFTTEIHVNFEYTAGQVFTFRGDDDLWIFVNGRLALDLGSMHVAVQGTIDFDAQAAVLGITPGGSYSMDIFQAERHTTGSNFRFETNISCFTEVEVPK